MLRFDKSRHAHPPNYLARREQYRLLMLVVSLGLVIILMGQLTQPGGVAVIERLLAGRVAPLPAPPNQSSRALPTTFLPGVDRDALEAIRDNTPFRSDETKAWFHLFSLLKSAGDARIAAASRGGVDYVEFIEQPQTYRGQIVTVRGSARRVEKVQPVENELGLTQYYRITLRPPGQQVWPIIVYALELPFGLTPADDMAMDVEVTGFFFKNWSYAWRDGLGLAPVVLARTAHTPIPTPDSPPVALPDQQPDAAEHKLDPEANVDPSSTSGEEASGVSSDRNAAPTAGQLRAILALAGWDADRLAKTNGTERDLLNLLWRLGSFDAMSLANWTRHDISAKDLVSTPEVFRGEIVRLTGRVVEVVHEPMSADESERMEMSGSFRCQVVLDGLATPATVVVAHRPQAWHAVATLDEPVSFTGLYVNCVDSTPFFLARRLAWHPTVAGTTQVSLGKCVLGRLGFDVGLFDSVQNRQPLRATEHEVFYQLMNAVGKTTSRDLARIARQELPNLAAEWSQRASPLASEVIRRASEGRYSVAPLFNDADAAVGSLVVLEGTARRVVRIDVGRTDDGRPTDVAERLNIHHYYEMDLFTVDSQDYPVVFCVRELPEGFPVGPDLHEPVRLAGFFLKSWRYHTRHAGSGGGTRQQFSPLVVGRGPMWLPKADAPPRQLPGAVAGGLVLGAIALVGLVTWRWAGRDGRLRRRTLDARYRLPEGTSLDSLLAPSDRDAQPPSV